MSLASYLNHLEAHRMDVLPRLESLIECLEINGVGSYIDLITRWEHVEAFLEGVSQLGVAIRAITLWCDYSPLNRERYGCPHGFGGPRNGEGFYSEMCEHEYFWLDETSFDFSQDDAVARSLTLAREYVYQGIPRRPDYSPCLLPGFWLWVPDDWERPSA